MKFRARNDLERIVDSIYNNRGDYVNNNLLMKFYLSHCREMFDVVNKNKKPNVISKEKPKSTKAIIPDSDKSEDMDEEQLLIGDFGENKNKKLLMSPKLIKQGILKGNMGEKIKSSSTIKGITCNYHSKTYFNSIQQAIICSKGKNNNNANNKNYNYSTNYNFNKCFNYSTRLTNTYYNSSRVNNNKSKSTILYNPQKEDDFLSKLNLQSLYFPGSSKTTKNSNIESSMSNILNFSDIKKNEKFLMESAAAAEEKQEENSSDSSFNDNGQSEVIKKVFKLGHPGLADDKMIKTKSCSDFMDREQALLFLKRFSKIEKITQDTHKNNNLYNMYNSENITHGNSYINSNENEKYNYSSENKTTKDKNTHYELATNEKSFDYSNGKIVDDPANARYDEQKFVLVDNRLFLKDDTKNLGKVVLKKCHFVNDKFNKDDDNRLRKGEGKLMMTNGLTITEFAKKFCLPKI